MNRLAAAAALLAGLSACGNYSTEDLRFIAALPTREDLVVEVPSQGDPARAAAAVCTAGSSDVWGWARPTSDNLNAMIDFLTRLVDAVRKVTPSHRSEDARRWGPFDDGRHPGKELQILLERTFPVELAGAPRYAYAFLARAKGTSTWTIILEGVFRGASATSGAGSLTLHFEALWLLEMAEPGSPRGPLTAAYDRASEPRTVAVELTQAGSGLEQFAYAYAGYRDRSGTFSYAFRNAMSDRFEVDAGFDRAGAGRLRVVYRGALGGTGGFEQCWDARACLTWVNDPLDLSCAARAGCSAGSSDFCPAVPLP